MKSQPLPQHFYYSFFVGHFLGSLGFALGFISPMLIVFTSFETLAITADRWNMSFDVWHLPFLVAVNTSHYLIFVVNIFVFTVFFMLPLSILTGPIAALAATHLMTGRLRTTLYGALVGLMVGLPLNWVVYGSGSGSGSDSDVLRLLDVGWMIGASAAGALFAQPIWTWCIRPRITPAAVGMPETRPRLRSLAKAIAWLAPLAAYLVALFLFG